MARENGAGRKGERGSEELEWELCWGGREGGEEERRPAESTEAFAKLSLVPLAYFHLAQFSELCNQVTL